MKASRQSSPVVLSESSITLPAPVAFNDNYLRHPRIAIITDLRKKRKKEGHNSKTVILLQHRNQAKPKLRPSVSRRTNRDNLHLDNQVPPGRLLSGKPWLHLNHLLAELPAAIPCQTPWPMTTRAPCPLETRQVLKLPVALLEPCLLLRVRSLLEAEWARHLLLSQATTTHRRTVPLLAIRCLLLQTQVP